MLVFWVPHIHWRRLRNKVEEISTDSTARIVKLWSFIIALMICHPTRSHYANQPARSVRAWGLEGGEEPPPEGSRAEPPKQNYFDKSL